MTDRPMRGLRGEHVYLRPLEPEDADLVAAWYADDRFRKLMGDPPMSLARRRRRYEDAVTGDGDDVFRFIICRLDDDRPVGRTDIFDIDRTNGSCAFGIGIGEPGHRGGAWAPTRSTPSSTSPSASCAWSGSGSTPMRTTSPPRRPIARPASPRRAGSGTPGTATAGMSMASGWRSCARSGWPCPAARAGSCSPWPTARPARRPTSARRVAVHDDRRDALDPAGVLGAARMRPSAATSVRSVAARRTGRRCRRRRSTARPHSRAMVALATSMAALRAAGSP